MKGLTINRLDPEDNLLTDDLYEFLHPIVDEIDPLYWCFDDDIQPAVGTLGWLCGDEKDGVSDGVMFDYLVDQAAFRTPTATAEVA